LFAYYVDGSDGVVEDAGVSREDGDGSVEVASVDRVLIGDDRIGLSGIVGSWDRGIVGSLVWRWRSVERGAM
jgi:hypothetical protein